MRPAASLKGLQQEIVSCERCPRLRAHCTRIAQVRKRAYREWEYWGRPVPSLGDPDARLLIVGLAPAAHGANRTGRMFTGDRSGDFLFRALYKAGFASQPESRARGDGLELRDAYITAVAHCAPPGNRPSPEEMRRCREYLEREMALLKRVRVVVALGRIAFDQCLGVVAGRKSGFAFAHNREFELGQGLPVLISSYHPSQQNTSTGRLTEAMLDEAFARARRRLEQTDL